LLAATSVAPISSTISLKSRDAGPLSFFLAVAKFQIVPSGARTAPPTPHIDFAGSFTGVAPAATAASNSARTSAGCATASDNVNPRNPLVASCDTRTRTRESGPKAAV